MGGGSGTLHTRHVFPRQRNLRFRRLCRSAAVQKLVFGVQVVERQVNVCLFHGSLARELVGREAGESGGEPAGICGALNGGVDGSGKIAAILRG